VYPRVRTSFSRIVPLWEVRTSDVSLAFDASTSVDRVGAEGLNARLFLEARVFDHPAERVLTPCWVPRVSVLAAQARLRFT